MDAKIKLMSASRQASSGLKAVHWCVDFAASSEHEEHQSLVGVYQAGGVSNFAQLLIKTPFDLPEWICETSLRETVARYFANQIRAAMEEPSSTVAAALRITCEVEDDYTTDTMPWAYVGTTLVKAHVHQESRKLVAASLPVAPNPTLKPPVKVGPYVQRVLNGASWPSTDGFPVRQEQANDCEDLFAWADRHGQFDRFLSRMTARPRERDATISEIRAARFLESLGARIESWEPAATSRPGEFEVRWTGSPPIFVEVKGPTCEGELTERGEEREVRKAKPRFVNRDGHWTDTSAEVRYAAEKTMGKLKADRPNLLVVADHLFVSPVKELERGALAAILSDSKFTGLGGVLCIDANWLRDDGSVDIRTLFEANPNAHGTSWAIPAQVVEAFGVAPSSAR